MGGSPDSVSLPGDLKMHQAKFYCITRCVALKRTRGLLAMRSLATVSVAPVRLLLLKVAFLPRRHRRVNSVLTPFLAPVLTFPNTTFRVTNTFSYSPVGVSTLIHTPWNLVIAPWYSI